MIIITVVERIGLVLLLVVTVVRTVVSKWLVSRFLLRRNVLITVLTIECLVSTPLVVM